MNMLRALAGGIDRIANFKPTEDSAALPLESVGGVARCLLSGMGMLMTVKCGLGPLRNCGPFEIGSDFTSPELNRVRLPGGRDGL